MQITWLICFFATDLHASKCQVADQPEALGHERGTDSEICSLEIAAKK